MSELKSMEELFEGRHFGREVIIVCVRWYLRFKLSLRDLVEMMAERGLSLAHTTILRWVQRYAPEFVKRWSRFGRPVGQSWRVDETYIKVRGEWRYLYRAVDRAGKTVNFHLSAKRDVAAAKAFFAKTVKSQGAPQTITLDGYAASHRAVHEMKADGLLSADTKVRSSKYLNNLIKQDHRAVKQRIAPMLGLKRFRNAATTVAGIELMHRIRKGQFAIGCLGVQGSAAPAIWSAVLGARESCLIFEEFERHSRERSTVPTICTRARGRDVGVPQPLLHLGDFGLTVERVGRRRRPHAVHPDLEAVRS